MNTHLNNPFISGHFFCWEFSVHLQVKSEKESKQMKPTPSSPNVHPLSTAESTCTCPLHTPKQQCEAPTNRRSMSKITAKPLDD